MNLHDNFLLLIRFWHFFWNDSLLRTTAAAAAAASPHAAAPLAMTTFISRNSFTSNLPVCGRVPERTE